VPQLPGDPYGDDLRWQGAAGSYAGPSLLERCLREASTRHQHGHVSRPPPRSHR
jgi:hypothetical protein